MNVGPYQLCALLSASEVGARYQAVDRRSEDPVEVVLLREDDPEAVSSLEARKRLQTAALIAAPSARRIIDLDLDASQPYLVLEALDGPTLWVQQQGTARLVGIDGPRVVLDLAMTVAAAHRIGFVHGRLGPNSVLRRGEHDWMIDFSTAILPGPANLPEGDERFRPPEALRGEAEPGSDVFSLAALLQWTLLDHIVESSDDGAKLAEAVGTLEDLRPGMDGLVSLLSESCLTEAGDRPALADFATRLRQLIQQIEPPASDASRFAQTSASLAGDPTAAPFEQTINTEVEVNGLPSVTLPTELGRFRLTEKLGQGGMGAVYRGEDMADGTMVAVKVLSGNASDNPLSRRRFAKEARMLARIKSPYVAKLLEFHDEGGTDFLVTEFVPGSNLAERLEQLGSINVAPALAVMSDICRGLATAHGHGIVHRDVKPDNILLTAEGLRHLTELGNGQATLPLAKLSDFGLARATHQTESLAITRQGAVMGTPYYMSPEQCRGEATDARSDVYSMGATLFHLLAGEPPFTADTHVGVLHKHCNEPIPSLAKLKPEIASGLDNVIQKALAKNPDARYADADALLIDLENLRLGQATSLGLHPRLPRHDAGRVVTYQFTWQLNSTSSQLWPFVANTDRLNYAIGLPPANFTTRNDPQHGVRRFAEMRIAGQQIAWEEHPYEWIEGRRMSILREFSRGPFEWFASIVELLPQSGGGTRLDHQVMIQPRNTLGRMIAHLEIGMKARRSLKRAYHQIDGFIAGGKQRDPTADAFRKPGSLGSRRRNRLQQRLDRVRDREIEPAVIETLGQYLEHASDQEVSRIRPKAFAARFGLNATQVIQACLHGTREGLLVLLWDILCPSCQIPANVQESLAAVQSHGHCEACNVDFELDFASSIEMIFRAHPEIRDVEVRTYCIGGPAFSAHVVAQSRIAAGERFAIEAALPEGAYRLRGPQLPYVIEFRTARNSAVGRWDVALSKPPPREIIPTLQVGSQVITLINDSPTELLVRLERVAARHDAVTAADASSLPLFRELLPDQVLSAGQMVSVATVTLLHVQLGRAADMYTAMGDGAAFAKIRQRLVGLEDAIAQHGGAVVKFVDEGIVATFNDPVKAVAAAFALPHADDEQGVSLDVRVALHMGPAMVTMFNDRLDYFGSTVHATNRLLDLAQPGDVMTTDSITNTPEVNQLIRQRGRRVEVVGDAADSDATLRGLIVQRCR